MREITIGAVRYLVSASEHGGTWTASATRADTGERFGVECSGETEAQAVDRLTEWLRWQDEHTLALSGLQRAERDYHRTIAGSAFVGPSEGPSAVEMQKESLDLVEAARQRLDEVRARRPN